MTTSNSARVNPDELSLVARIRVLIVLTSEKVFWKTAFYFRKGHGSNTYAIPGIRSNPYDIICKNAVHLVLAKELGQGPLKKKETVVKKIDGFFLPEKTDWDLPFGVEGRS
jgi:hypothetical protein